MVHDVNAARAMRAEARGETFQFVIDGEVFSIPLEMELEKIDDMEGVSETDYRGVLKVLLGEDQARRLARHRMTVQDFRALVEAYNEQAGMTPGESGTSQR